MVETNVTLTKPAKLLWVPTKTFKGQSKSYSIVIISRQNIKPKIYKHKPLKASYNKEKP
jgi:hypothetical protein